MDIEEVDMLLEVERCKMRAEQNKDDIDDLENGLRNRLTAVETDVEILKTTSTKIYAYVAAISAILAILAWIIDHKGLFQ